MRSPWICGAAAALLAAGPVSAQTFTSPAGYLGQEAPDTYYPCRNRDPFRIGHGSGTGTGFAWARARARRTTGSPDQRLEHVRRAEALTSSPGVEDLVTARGLRAGC